MRPLAVASRRSLWLAVACSILAGCSPIRGIPDGERPRYTEVGLASWYGPAHDGRATASGERFDMEAMTGAHRTLPFGTVVRVTNLETGRSVQVRINDRGPYVSGRVIDLSSRAAAALGLKRAGVARVRIEIIGREQQEG